MPRARVVLLLLLALLAGACGSSRGRGDVATPATPTTTAAARKPGDLVVIGDSLAAGTAPLLPHLLPGWTIRSDAHPGRPLATGMALLDARPRPTRRTVLLLSLFTNDDPSHVEQLAAAVERSRAWVGDRGCVVWATIVRPPVDGLSYHRANARLRGLGGELAPDVRVVDWAAEVAGHRGWLVGDGVHGTPQGYRARAALLADAVRSCRLGG